MCHEHLYTRWLGYQFVVVTRNLQGTITNNDEVEELQTITTFLKHLHRTKGPIGRCATVGVKTHLLPRTHRAAESTLMCP